MKILGRMWRIYCVSAIFFLRRVSAVASQASGTGAVMAINAESVPTPWPYHDSERICFYQWSHFHWTIWKIDITAPIHVSTGHVTMMTPSNGSIFRVTGPLWIHRSPVHWQRPMPWRGFFCFLWTVPRQMVEQTIETPVIWHAIALIMTSL